MAVKHINLALQGGGAHGAFTWGVLDRLLDEEDVEIAGISGTSAGALNGAAYKAGMLAGGREGARASLDAIWNGIGADDLPGLAEWFTAATVGPVAQAMELSPFYAWSDALARTVSPYSYGPFYRNAVLPLVQALNFENVCSEQGPELFICATAVRTGKIRIFTRDEITTDAILASACLPTMFQAVEIDDPRTGRREAYWDGGYTGNPALFPLFAPSLPDDILIVNINPLERDHIPITPQQIQNRINEISFNSSLLRELRAIAFVQRLLDDGTLTRSDKSRVLVHMISDDDLMNELSVATKLIPNPLVINQLKHAGRNMTERFLAEHKKDLNKRSTIDLAAMYS